MSGDGASTKPYRVIVKHGDDLRQDQVVLQSVPVWKLLMDLFDFRTGCTSYGFIEAGDLDMKLTWGSSYGRLERYRAVR